jgi:hypothetical protein
VPAHRSDVTARRRGNLTRLISFAMTPYACQLIYDVHYRGILKEENYVNRERWKKVNWIMGNSS